MPSEHRTPDDAYLEELVQTVEKLAAADTQADVARIVRTAARRLAGADGVAVVLAEGDRVRYLDEDAVGPLWKGCDFPADRCISGWAIKHRQQVVIEDIRDDERIPQDLYANTFVGSLVMTPVGRPHPLAAIGAYWRERRTPSPAELARLDAIARATAVALQNVRLRGELRTALARAESASRVKSDFLTNMSHEIRTPLNGIVGAAEMLRLGELSPSQKELLGILSASAASLDQVLGEILDFARMQSGVAPLVEGAFQLGDAIRDTCRMFELRVARKRLAFSVSIDPAAEAAVFGDRARIKQVLANLLSNALKFTETGAVSVTVTPHSEAARWIVEVRDTGAGIGPEVRERLFQAPEEVAPSNADAGSALGLVVSRQLAEGMGATLEAAPAADGGTIMTLVVTLSPVELPSKTATPEPVPSPPPSTPVRVLVVDDHPTNRKILELLLASAGAEFVSVADGEQACRTFEGGAFDLVLMDIQMPVMDGIAATRAIRQWEAARGLARTPILMLTANVLPEHREASLAAGADRHLAKPVRPMVLFSAMEAALADAA